MKCFLGISLMIMQIFINEAEAADNSKTGVSIDDSRGITLRYINENNHAFDVGARFGKSRYESESGFHLDRSSTQLVLGYRKYTDKDKIEHFYGSNLILLYVARDDSDNLNGDYWRARLEIIYGLEYSLGSNINIEGKVGFSATYYNYTSDGRKTREYTIPITGVAVNYYW